MATDLLKSNNWAAVYPYSAVASFNSYPLIIATEQRQSSSNSTAHLAGSNVPLYGTLTDVALGTEPVFQMHHLASFVKIVVTNTRWYETTIKDVELVLEDAALCGGFNLDLSSPSLTAGGVQSKVKVTLDTPAVIDKNEGHCL